MEFIKLKDEKECSKFVAGEIIKLVKNNKKANLGLATGSTPIQTYKYLIEDFNQNKTNWKKIKTFNLDEYLGLPAGHKQSYKVFMSEMLFEGISIKPKNVFFPNTDQNYDKLIASEGGIDFQLLGIGTNGHIGFNEPGSELESLTRIVDLTEETINVNANKFFDGDTTEVPKQAISMGLKSILEAKKIVLLALGESKREVVSKLLDCKEFDINFPASALTLHDDVTIIYDEEASI